MNNIGKAGAILIIIGGAVTALAGILLLAGGTALIGISGSGIVIGIAIAMMALGVLDIVFSALALVGKKSGTIAGVLAIVSILLAWLAWVVGAIVLLVGGILILCGKREQRIDAEASNLELGSGPGPSVVDALN